MANPSKRKGDAFKRAVRGYLRDEGFQVIVPEVGQAKDEGDLFIVVPNPITVELKNHRNVADGVRLGVDEAIVEAENAGNKRFVAIVKRPRKNVRDAYVIVPLWKWIEDLKGSDS